jgi:hypothetical protein
MKKKPFKFKNDEIYIHHNTYFIFSYNFIKFMISIFLIKII